MARLNPSNSLNFSIKDFVDTFVSLISGVVVTSVTADLAVRVTLFTLLAGFAVTFLTETTVSLTVLGDADLAVLVAEVLLRVAINVKSKKIGVRTYVCRGSI